MGKTMISSARILDGNGVERVRFHLGSDLVVEMTFSVPSGHPLKKPVMGS